jgi:hypothetical protein
MFATNVSFFFSSLSLFAKFCLQRGDKKENPVPRIQSGFFLFGEKWVKVTKI